MALWIFLESFQSDSIVYLKDKMVSGNQNKVYDY